MKLLLIYCLFIGLTMVLSCIHSENFECFCSGNEIECAGSGDNTVEMPQLLLNISSIHPSRYLESLVLNMTNLTLPNELNHIDLEIRNLSLFNVLLDLEEDSLKGVWASLKFLKIQNCNLESVGKLFNNLYNLTELNLDYNKITELKSDDILNMNKLEYLSIAENELCELDEDLIVGLPVLQTLSVNGNNFSVFSNVKITSSSLTELSIQNCHIKGSLEENSLIGVPHVMYLDLSCNQLEIITTHALASLTDIKVLNLSKNVIKHLEGNAFSKMSNLETLDLSHNSITVIKLNAFYNLKHLENFDLSFNILTGMLCNYTYDMPSLKRMDLRHNSIETIEYGTFLNNSKLEELFFEGNALDVANATICSPLMDMNISFVDIDIKSKNCEYSSTCDEFAKPDDDDDMEDDDDEEYATEDEAGDNEYHNATSNTSTYDFSKVVFAYSTVYNGTISLTDFIVSTIMEDEATTGYDMDSSSQIFSSHFIASITTHNNASIDLFNTTEQSSSVLENVTPTIPLNSNIDTLKTSEITDYDIDSSPVSSTYLIEATAIGSDLSTNIFSNINQNISLTEYAIHSSIPLENFDDSIIPTPSIQVDNTVYITIDSNVENNSSISSLYFKNYTDAAVYHSSVSSILLNASIKVPSETQTIEVMYNDTESSNFADSVYITEMIMVESMTTSSLISISGPIATNIPLIDVTSTVSKLNETSLTYSTPIEKKPVSTKAKVTFINYTYITNDLCLKWELTLPENIPLEKVRCTLSPVTSNKTTKIRNSKTVKCPKSGITAEDCVTVSQMEKFCITVHFSKRPIKKVCSKEHSPELTTTNTVSTDVLITSSTASILKSILNVDTTSTDETILTSSPDEVGIMSSTAPPSIPERKLSPTATTNYIPFSISIPDRKYSPTVPTSIPETKHLPTTVYNYIPFSVTSFEVILNDSNSAFAVWSVSKYESMSQCNLTLTLFNEKSIYTEVAFKCMNNSYLMKHLEEKNSYKICLKSHHIKHGIENRCKWNSDPLYKSSASKRKDHGYKNSSLFAVSILLLVVLALIIGIVLRNLFKKRFIKDRYNVYIEEQNVQKRYSSIHQEPNVRYSSTPKE